MKKNEIEEIEEIEENIKQVSLGKPTVHKTHKWRQKGYYLVCQSCPSRHGFYIGKDKIMTGIDEKGQPILEKRI